MNSFVAAGVLSSLFLGPPVREADHGFVAVTVGVTSVGFVSQTKATVGGQLGIWFDKLGVEGDFGLTSHIAGPGTVNMRTIAFDVLFGPKLANGKWRVYGAAGIGLIGAVARISDVFQVTSSRVQNDWAATGGAGLMGTLAPHLGVCADVRYFRGLMPSHDPTAKRSLLRVGGGVVLTF